MDVGTCSKNGRNSYEPSRTLCIGVFVAPYPVAQNSAHNPFWLILVAPTAGATISQCLGVCSSHSQPATLPTHAHNTKPTPIQLQPQPWPQRPNPSPSPTTGHWGWMAFVSLCEWWMCGGRCNELLWWISKIHRGDFWNFTMVNFDTSPWWILKKSLWWILKKSPWWILTNHRGEFWKNTVVNFEKITMVNFEKKHHGEFWKITVVNSVVNFEKSPWWI